MTMKDQLIQAVLWTVSQRARLGPPVEAVEIEHLCDVHESRQVVEAVVDEEEEPEVDPHARLSVARRLARGLVPVTVAVVGQRVLGERNGAPGDGEGSGEEDEDAEALPPDVDEALHGDLARLDPEVPRAAP
jgi:hypothetical protein